MRRVRGFMFVAVILAVAGCGRGSTPATSQAPAGSSSPSATNTSASPSGSPTVDATGASKVALTLFRKSPNNLNNPSAGYIWTSVSWTVSGGPLSAPVKARLAALNKSGYFSARGCGESYIDGTQYGLLIQPRILSAHAIADGSVTVVLRRADGHSSPPNLTVVMTRQGATWLVTDLASGTGPSASIFSAKPNC